MAVWTEKPEIIHRVVVAVAIYVIELKYKWFTVVNRLAGALLTLIASCLGKILFESLRLGALAALDPNLNYCVPLILVGTREGTELRFRIAGTEQVLALLASRLGFAFP